MIEKLVTKIKAKLWKELMMRELKHSFFNNINDWGSPEVTGIVTSGTLATNRTYIHGHLLLLAKLLKHLSFSTVL